MGKRPRSRRAGNKWTPESIRAIIQESAWGLARPSESISGHIMKRWQVATYALWFAACSGPASSQGPDAAADAHIDAGYPDTAVDARVPPTRADAHGDAHHTDAAVDARVPPTRDGRVDSTVPRDVLVVPDGTPPDGPRPDRRPVARDASPDTGPDGATSVCQAGRERIGTWCCRRPTVCPNPAACSPVDGTFVVPAELNSGSLDAFFSELDSLGMRVLILNAVRHKQGDCSSGTFVWGTGLPGLLTEILNRADARGMQVYVGLVHTQLVCTGPFYAEPNASQAVSDTQWTLSQIAPSLSGHPSLSGWYIPDEPHLSDWADPSLTFDYYRRLVSAIRSVSNLPVLVAPELTGSQNKTPQEIANRAVAFRTATGVDIFVWQDSVGAEGISLGWYGTGFDTGAYFRAISNAVGIAHLWSDNELFTCCTNLPPYPPNWGGAYRPGPVARIARQLELSPPGVVSRRVVWLEQHHASTTAPTHHPEAARLLAAFKARYGLGGVLIQPTGYHWDTPPDPSYPDSGSEMFDGVTGAPTDHWDPHWTGLRNGATITIDLGGSYLLDWVGLDLLDEEASGIRFPTAMDISCSNGGGPWQTVHSEPFPAWITRGDSTYVFGNLTPLGVVCDRLRIHLTNSWWTFLGEIELVASATDCTTAGSP